jgi:hypothetical protein
MVQPPPPPVVVTTTGGNTPPGVIVPPPPPPVVIAPPPIVQPPPIITGPPSPPPIVQPPPIIVGPPSPPPITIPPVVNAPPVIFAPPIVTAPPPVSTPVVIVTAPPRPPNAPPSGPVPVFTNVIVGDPGPGAPPGAPPRIIGVTPSGGFMNITDVPRPTTWAIPPAWYFAPPRTFPLARELEDVARFNLVSTTRPTRGRPGPLSGMYYSIRPTRSSRLAADSANMPWIPANVGYYATRPDGSQYVVYTNQPANAPPAVVSSPPPPPVAVVVPSANMPGQNLVGAGRITDAGQGRSGPVTVPQQPVEPVVVTTSQGTVVGTPAPTNANAGVTQQPVIVVTPSGTVIGDPGPSPTYVAPTYVAPTTSTPSGTWSATVPSGSPTALAVPDAPGTISRAEFDAFVSAELDRQQALQDQMARSRYNDAVASGSDNLVPVPDSSLPAVAAPASFPWFWLIALGAAGAGGYYYYTRYHKKKRGGGRRRVVSAPVRQPA